ncbi:MAG: prepilin-type N-terminal cleavage/methylation domain-containing protein [Candidatus Eremiobacterota bacterium]
MRPTEPRAFTLVEVLVALALIAVALLAVVAVGTASIRMSAKSSNLSAAAMVAETELSRAIYEAVNDQPPGSASAFWDNDWPESNPWTTGTRRVGNTDFEFAVDATTVNDATTGAELGTGASQNRLKLVHVVVWWWDSKQQRKLYGRLRTESDRLVNELAP